MDVNPSEAAGDGPRAASRDARRLKILEIARDVFIEEGFACTSMSAIAGRVGGSKATLYSYFASKEALFTAVVHYECRLRIEAMFDGDRTDLKGDVEAVLRSFGRRYIEVVLGEENMRFARMLVAEARRHPELAAIFYEAGPRRSHARMAAYVETQIAAGVLHCADPHRAVQQFCDLCIGGLYMKRIMNIVPPPDAIRADRDVEVALSFVSTLYLVIRS